jgi:dTDP-4-amino-4,6-dideoxygalactose transaminase
MKPRVPFVDLLAQYEELKDEIDSAIADTIRNSAFIGGKNVEDFEQRFSRLLDVKHCVSCANGTDALYITLKALGLKRGDEVITTAHSWISTSEAVTQAGGKVVFCDTTADTFCINEDLIEEKVTNKTVGLIPVHLYGHPAEMNKIMEIASKYKLWVVEDCAQAHMAGLQGKNVGSFGNAATFSFYPGKNLGAMGDAGAIITNDDNLAEWISLFSKHGGKGKHVIEGINSRMDGIQAAILNAKMPHLREWTTARRNAASYYNEKLAQVTEISSPITRHEAFHVFHLYTLLCNKRDELRLFLKNHGVETNINYPVALPFLPAYAYLSCFANQFPIAYSNQSRILSLPLFPEISRDQQDYVCALISKFYAN